MEKKLLDGQEESKDEDMEGRWGLSPYIVDPRSTFTIIYTSIPDKNSLYLHERFHLSH